MSKAEIKGIKVGELTFDITVEGPDEQAEKAIMDVHDRAVRVGRAFENGHKHPDECEGLPFTVAWDRLLELSDTDAKPEGDA